MEGHRSFLRGGGSLNPFLEAMYEAKLEFLGGGRGGRELQNKKHSMGEYGYFLELYNYRSVILTFHSKSLNEKENEIFSSLGFRKKLLQGLFIGYVFELVA